MTATAHLDLLEGLPVGVSERTRGRTIGEGDFAALTSITWTTDELHTNREFAKENSPFGERVLGPIVVLAVASGLLYQSLWDRFSERFGVVANGAVALEARHEKPVFPGDTLYVETCLESARASESHSGHGVLVFSDKVFNQRDETVATMKRILLFRRTSPVSP
jgi:acyl dehydratase